jgi:hypothetical protein
MPKGHGLAFAGAMSLYALNHMPIPPVSPGFVVRMQFDEWTITFLDVNDI